MKARIWVAAVLAPLVVIVSCSGKKDEPSSTNDAQEQSSRVASGDGTPAAQTEGLGALVDMVVAQANVLPRAEFDPAALAKQLGRNPQAHFEWVRDNTWWAPYRGLLRGSQGVMLDRIGSNLDRAVLLGDLLRRSGYRVRIAHGQIPDDRAREVLARVRPMPDSRRASLAPAERQGAVKAAPPGQEESVQVRFDDSRRRAAEAQALIGSQAEQLRAAVGGAVDGGRQSDLDAIAALRDHWWIEREENGRWVPMDVLLQDSVIGSVVVASAGTSAWGSTDEAPSIPEGDWHTVRIRVIVERLQDDARKEETALEALLRPAEVLRKPITLAHRPHPWPEHLPDPQSEPNGLGNAAVSVKEWIPFLRVGTQVVAQSGFTDGGLLITDALNPQRDISETGGAGFMEGFGEALGGSETAESSMTAEWIEFEIYSPGLANVKLRRPVFDLLGPAMRASGTRRFDANANDLLIERYEALLSTTDILLQPCDFTGAFVSDLWSAGIVRQRAELKKLSQELDPAKARDLAFNILRNVEIWGPLVNFVRWRSAIAPAPGEWFIDRPNVATYRFTPPVVNADRIEYRQLIDVASNSIGVRANAHRKPFDIRVEQGVADTVAEALALGDDIHSAENTASVFHMAGDDAARRVFMAPRDDEAIGKLGLSEDVVARLAQSVNAGFVAVIPTEPVALGDRQRTGWWRVDPFSGETIGVMDTGFHADTTEEALMNARQTLSDFLFDPHNWRRYRSLRWMRQNNLAMSAESRAELELMDGCMRTIAEITKALFFPV